MPLQLGVSYMFVACALLILAILNVVVLWSDGAKSVLYEQWLPVVAGSTEQKVGYHVWFKSREPTPLVPTDDEHPIKQLMSQADSRFQHYDNDRSKTFSETVQKYRRQTGRHPPPGFKEWYRLARKKRVYNIDDFAQINHDLRPFWAIPPAEIRSFAAHSSDEWPDLIATISLRDGQVFQEEWGWRSETFVKMLKQVARYLPDMDIPINRMDQPRVVVPWENLQAYLKTEEESRSLDEQGVEDAFTKGMPGFFIPRFQVPEPQWLHRWNPFVFPKYRVSTADDPRPDYGWFNFAGGKFMDLAAKACPPGSYATDPTSELRLKEAEKLYKHDLGGLITNFNISSDLCTVGPQLASLHGMLYASSSMLVTHKLVPIFGECRTNINNDILFPANMYWKRDKRYSYNDEHDINWDDKDDTMIWRGVTSGGNTVDDDPERWRNMHRQRLVLITNSTELGAAKTDVLANEGRENFRYTVQQFTPANFAKDHFDVGFTEKVACIPNCDFYDSSLTILNKTSFTDTFRSKYLIDVDGHSFSGRWRAFLQSRSLGLKATIFREWHDSRLFAWRHFVPMDNRYDDLYSLLLYFIGFNPSDQDPVNQVTVWSHDYEAMKLARQGREWAAKVLRPEDIEVYLLRLLLEYGRIIDDNRDRIGVVGDGGEEMRAFDIRVPAVP
ncbi:hypothetical protein AC578_11039 [Pseudocercospora eumusae]|uniref:Glycosyl transferase CAP10 domain-containing protein n=1 Tax=Pseudocercospora eumusae TaxID=321146 RepID=A0A139HSD4_9PEZI|nr:hypothetical protein AC578_11039 [Pseudocercospora eumusae]